MPIKYQVGINVRGLARIVLVGLVAAPQDAIDASFAHSMVLDGDSSFEHGIQMSPDFIDLGAMKFETPNMKGAVILIRSEIEACVGKVADMLTADKLYRLQPIQWPALNIP
ncbi:hypothetical protein N7520_008942 [Penicillium odoratum]|uniref:uncharacterized protein n=1 Tax=Penicillium odoratum TaxID=1167516 RepID=UPI002547E003|nr:uncharacterized protein N7520_008942 [Penicillium odoratum]KAJ5752025.1 hypothetical protein N7520_008942 [Penicillium odoratum]